MKSKTIYTKKFRRINKLQERQTLRYNLIEEETGDLPAFGIQLISDRKGVIEIGFRRSLTSSKKEALDLLAFLYENAITLNTWQDVVTDLMQRMHPIRLINPIGAYNGENKSTGS